MTRRIATVLLLLLFVGACTPFKDDLSASEPKQISSCRALLTHLDRIVEQEGVRDAEAQAVSGYPYLRVNRFLASFRDEVTDHAAFNSWVAAMAELDAEARAIEISNLPPEISVDVADRRSISTCANRLRAFDLNDARRRQMLRDAVEMPDHYLDVRRIVGFYPAAAVLVATGYEIFKSRYLNLFGEPGEATAKETIRFVPAVGRPLAANDVVRLSGHGGAGPLMRPSPTPADERRLLEAFAPIVEIAPQGRHDRIGWPYWPSDSGPIPMIDVARPVVFGRIAYTRFGNQNLLQLVYTLWFPARPKEGVLDLVGGHIDGIIWRVTLGTDGRPFTHDSIHPCGCYHVFFPVPPTRRRTLPEDRDLREAPLTPGYAPVLNDAAAAAGERLVVHLTPGDHYVQSLSIDSTKNSDSAVPYTLVSARPGEPPDNRLRSMPAGGRRKSLYGPDGLVAGTERGERYILWPMGIESAGQMRQWGTHATAFVGRRHFDDPRLFERTFTR